MSTAELIARITECLVDHPEMVVVEAETSGAETVFHVSVSPEDLGKVIGKQGRTAKSLRVLLGAMSSQCGCRFALDIVRIPVTEAAGVSS